MLYCFKEPGHDSLENYQKVISLEILNFQIDSGSGERKPVKVFAQKVTHTKSFLSLLSTFGGRKSEVKWAANLRLNARISSLHIRNRNQQWAILSVLATHKVTCFPKAP